MLRFLPMGAPSLYSQDDETGSDLMLVEISAEGP
jgi:hypothetical protein